MNFDKLYLSFCRLTFTGLHSFAVIVKKQGMLSSPAPRRWQKTRNWVFYVSKKSHVLIAKLSATIRPKLLINGYIIGQRIILNLDTGAQIFIPSTHLPSMTPASFELQSYNGTSINVCGSICATFNLGLIKIDEAVSSRRR